MMPLHGVQKNISTNNHNLKLNIANQLITELTNDLNVQENCVNR
jgi:hypothetical protein